MSKIALLVSIMALGIASASWVFAAINSMRRLRLAARPLDSNEEYIRASALLDARSFLQEALKTIATQMDLEGVSRTSPARRLARLLAGSPILAASQVIADVRLAQIERDLESGEVWIVTNNDAIEFTAPQMGGAFAGAVVSNLSEGLKYRYLVADSMLARERAARIVSDYPAIDIRFIPASYWSPSDRFVDEFVIYVSNNRDPRVQGYYLYPGSSPLKWIEMDQGAANARYGEAQAQWSLASAGQDQTKS